MSVGPPSGPLQEPPGQSASVKTRVAVVLPTRAVTGAATASDDRVKLGAVKITLVSAFFVARARNYIAVGGGVDPKSEETANAVDYAEGGTQMLQERCISSQSLGL